MKDLKNTKVLIAIGVVLVAAVFAGGYFFGEQTGYMTGQTQGESKYKTVVEGLYPKPPQELHSLIGTVTAIYGATLQLEVSDPTDYLPHTDGTPRAKQTRMANTTPVTSFVLLDYSKIDKNNNPKITPLSLSDVKVGTMLTVESSENIITAQKFDVTKVILVKY